MAELRRNSDDILQQASSQSHCLLVMGGDAREERPDARVIQADSATYMPLSLKSLRQAGKRTEISSEELAADARSRRQ